MTSAEANRIRGGDGTQFRYGIGTSLAILCCIHVVLVVWHLGCILFGAWCLVPGAWCLVCVDAFF
jgi:hypothetical protein